MQSISLRCRFGFTAARPASSNVPASKHHSHMIPCGMLMLSLAACDGSSVAPDFGTNEPYLNRNSSSLSITPSSAAIAVSETVQLTATSSSVQWSSSAPDVATVSSSGLVTGIAAGSVTVTAKDRNKTATAAITVTAPSSTPATCSGHTYSRLVNVSTAAQLTDALKAAQPGDMIHMADGTYTGRFTATASGTGNKRIVLCGTSKAVIQTGTMTDMYALVIQASHWVLDGFTVTNSQAGIRIQGGHHNTLQNLAVHGIGQEAVKINSFSTHNVLQNSQIHNTGLTIPEYGEGVYIGSWNGHWCSNSGCEPDRSDYNRVLNNIIGPDIGSEHIDVKEGTTGGLISGNTFDGVGMGFSKDYNDSWVVIHGNGYTVSENTGNVSVRDGFQTDVMLAGWGNNNTFTNNTADVQASGYGFRIAGGSVGNIVRCQNKVVNAKSGFANVSCS